MVFYILAPIVECSFCDIKNSLLHIFLIVGYYFVAFALLSSVSFFLFCKLVVFLFDKLGFDKKKTLRVFKIIYNTADLFSNLHNSKK